MVRRAVLLAMGALFGLGACAAPRMAEPPPPGLDFAGAKGSAVALLPPPEPPPRDPVSATVPVVRVTVAPLPPLMPP